jgi:hypothetical protein
VARLTWRDAAGNGGVSAALGQQWGGFGQRGGGFEPGDGAVGMSAREARRRRSSDSGGAVETPARGPDSALKARERRGCMAATLRRRADRRARRR